MSIAVSGYRDITLHQAIKSRPGFQKSHHLRYRTDVIENRKRKEG